MRHIILLIAVMAMVGCGKKTTPSEPEANTEPEAAANKSTPPKVFIKPGDGGLIRIGDDERRFLERGMLEVEVPGTSKAEAKIPINAFINTLGMAFVKVPATKVQFCIWETRVKDYAAYAAANDGVNEEWKEPLYYRGASFKQLGTHPVVNVNWEDAQAFCAWLTKKELAERKIKAGQKYRLPTDSEWSIAVGLGKEKGNTPREKDVKFLSLDNKDFKSVYPWGTEWPPREGVGNYRLGGPSINITDKFEFTSPVGSFATGKLGLHDLGGNVWEWCEDLYDPAENDFPDRVFRGASWADNDPDTLLSAARNGFISTSYRISFIGFRCVLADE